MDEQDNYTDEDYQYGNGALDPQTKRYFKKVLSSFFTGIFWMLFMSTLGLFFGLGIIDTAVRWYNLVFYVIFLLSLAWLIRYYYRLWK